MAEEPHFAELAPELAAGWLPVFDRGTVRIGFDEQQVIFGSLFSAGVALVAIGVAVVFNAPLLFLATVLASTGHLWIVVRSGVELAETTITMRRGPLVRSARWSSVNRIDSSEGSRTKLHFDGGKSMSVLAPRRRWVVVDPSFDAKAKFIEAWWDERRRDGPGVVGVPAIPTAPKARPVAQERNPATEHNVKSPTSEMVQRADLFSVESEPASAGPAAEGSFPLGTIAGLFATAVVVGYLFVGRDVLVLAIALLVLFRFGRDPGRPLALAAFALLVVSGVFTIVQNYPPKVTLQYSSQRTIAAEAGAIVGVFLVLATIIFAFTERSPDLAFRRPMWRGAGRADLAAMAKVLPPWLQNAAPFAGIGLVAFLIRVVGSPGGLPPAYDRLLDNLRLGTSYSLATPSGGKAVGVYPPLGATIGAYFPLGPKVALIIVSLATVAVVGICAQTRWGRPSAIMATGVAAVMPSLWTQQLPVQLAGLCILGGVVLGDPNRITPRRAGLAGLCLGLAFLARPEAGITAAAIVIVWIVSQRGARARGELASLLAALTILCAPWCNFIWSTFATRWPMSSLGATLNDPSTVSRLPALVEFVLGSATVVALVPSLRNLAHNTWARLPFFVLPVAALALALTNVPGRDPLSWSAPIVAVVIGPWLAWIARTRIGSTRRTMLDPTAVPEWELEISAARERVGVAARPSGILDPDRSVIDPEPDEDHLFM